MESTMVIKVKYGETLRRFNLRVVDEELDLNMDGLREKIVCLFNFAPDADLTLTYIDEDGDVVTLVDEEDLHDVIRQSLNPLRITVRLNTEKSGRSYIRSSGSSTPLRSPRAQHPLQNLNTRVSEILTSVPEPLREALSKLPFDLASKATSTAPGLAELVDYFLKLGPRLTSLNEVPESGTQTGASLGTMGFQKDSKVEGATSEMLPNAISEAPTVKDNEVFPNSENVEPIFRSSEVDHGNMNSGVEASIMPAPGFVNINSGLPFDNYLFGSASADTSPVNVAVDNNEEVVKKFGEYHSTGKSYANVTPVASNIPAGDKNKEVKKSNGRHHRKMSVGVGASRSRHDFMKGCKLDSQTTDLGGGLKTKISSDSGNPLGSRFGLNSIKGCPFTGKPVANDSIVPPQYAPRAVPSKRSYSHSDGIRSIFHRGVCCDGCGAHPITGPRFKSIVKEDYDLCSICFSEMGNVIDYVRIDHPLTCRQPSPFKGLYDPMHNFPACPPTLPPVLRGCGMKPSQPKLDSCFIRDVSIIDGTIMAPSTPFTKIWRMRNNGTIVWPQGTQLVWIGGNYLSNTLSVSLEISADGLAVDKELDIAVDFTAPEFPGRHISYWRMALPSGQKFGQRVWVFIQVDASLKDWWCESADGLNLNLPPVTSGIEDTKTVNVKAEPIVDSLVEPNDSNRATELLKPIVDALPIKDQELNFPINDSLLVGGGLSSPVRPKSSSTISYPIIGLSGEAPAVASSSSSAQEVRLNRDAEQNLLSELETMGFKQVGLNKEILRMNEYNLEQSLDDLCGVAEWDPIFDELQEMGFCDKEVNKRLLKKNNGSIKRVVMDLISGEGEGEGEEA